MQKTTAFAIKANIASVLLSFIISFLAGYLLSNLFLNIFFAGIFSVVVSYVSTYYATSMLLKNSHLAKADALASISQTWRIYLIVGVVLVLFNINDTLGRGAAFTIFTALTFVAAYMAFTVLKKRQR